MKVWICDLWCSGIHQSSTVKRYKIYRLTEYIQYMFTTKSLKENLLIQMWLTLTNKTQVFHAYVLITVIPHSCGGLLGLAKCKWEKKRENMKSEGTTLEGKWKVICKVQMKSHFFGFGFGFDKWCDWLINFWTKFI